MQLVLLKTTDDDNVVGKVLTDDLVMDLFMRGDADINNPSLPLRRVDGLDYLDYNYASIPELGRFYFIREWAVVNFAIFRAELEIDYLQTYAAKIKAAQGTFNRPIKPGDYGDVEPDVTGRTIESQYKSTITLEPGGEGILSLIKPE